MCIPRDTGSHWNVPARRADSTPVLPVLLTCALLSAPPGPSPAQAAPWRELAPGVAYARWPARPGTTDEGELEVVRLDPARVRADVGAVAADGGEPRTAALWAEAVKARVVVVTNAGMFDTDRRTHTGYLAVDGRELNPKWVRSYRSMFVFDPSPGAPAPMALVELDTPGARRDVRRWRGRVQNLRLVAAPGEVKWTKAERRWSEAALAADRAGHILVIFVRAPQAMTTLAPRLVAQLGVVSAQHLEGGPEASLSVRAPGLRLDLAGSPSPLQWPLPNVLVFTAR